ncbi:MAG: SusD/RagB family nutrient-binding outer membrane lipoprotein [Flavobacteriales bacterium]
MKKHIFLATGVIAALAFSGCRKDFEEINTDPNQPTDVSPGFLLTAAQKSIMDETYDAFWGSRGHMQLAQFWASNQYSNESRYQFRNETANGTWRDLYAGPLADLQQIIDLNTERPDDMAGYGANANQIAVAKILQAWVYQHLTDNFGAIPMSEALQGAENTTPAYDSQDAVYTQLLALVNDALSTMDVGAAGPQGDQIYGGSMAHWQKFGNSLKLRIAMRMADVNAGVAQTAAEQALAGGAIVANADNALFSYLGGAPNNNPINEDAKTRNDFAASNVMVDYLAAHEDPRMAAFYAPAASSGAFVGEVYGLSEANAALTPDADVSQRSETVLAADLPGIYFDAAQTHFLAAEAAERGWATPLSAAGHYEEAIRLSMAYWGVDAAAADAYLARADVAYATAPGSWKERIGAQKWIALYMQGAEAWAEYRRLDFGILQLPVDGVLNGSGIPARLQYPLDEQTLNAAEYAGGVSANGGADDLDTKMWWDVN